MAKQDSARRRAERELQWWTHCSDRYESHRLSQSFAQKELQRVRDRLANVKTGKGRDKNDLEYWSQLEFLEQANVQLLECRRILKYTYVFAYNTFNTPPIEDTSTTQAATSSSTSTAAPDTDNKDDEIPTESVGQGRFLHQQDILERFTERLTGLAEQPLSNDFDGKAIMDLTGSAHELAARMLNVVNEL